MRVYECAMSTPGNGSEMGGRKRAKSLFPDFTSWGVSHDWSHGLAGPRGMAAAGSRAGLDAKAPSW